jgi:cystathionine beta-synthase
MWLDSILETIGNTPLIRLNKLNEGLEPTFLAKVEYFNPGQSVKDRIALKMIEDAEKDGTLKPGATIIEGTSGNTGMGLALAAVIKGYSCIFTTTDKQSIEKVNLLRALGAEVRICPTNVEPDDPRSYYSVARRLAKEIPNSWYPNQYDNLSNTQAHYESTGPEIWRQTEGLVTHFVAGMGTGGTITGAAKYLKEQNSTIKVIGVDSIGSVYKSYSETGVFDKTQIGPYLTEGIGEDIIPANIDFQYIDEVIQCPDRDAFLTTRALARKEAMFVGGSCGAAVWGALEYARKEKLDSSAIVVVLLPDSGTRYVSKIYNDEWMQSNGFLGEVSTLRAVDIAELKSAKKQSLSSIDVQQTIADAIDIMHQMGISQLPVTKNEIYAGSISENRILNLLIEDASVRLQPVGNFMEKPFPVVGSDTKIDQLSKLFDKGTGAVLVAGASGSIEIITKSDLIHVLSRADQQA